MYKPTSKSAEPALCYNCWGSNHLFWACKQPRRNLYENETLRMRLGVPFPAHDPSYRKAVQENLCTNCWGKGHHRDGCPEPKLTVAQCERKRVLLGVPMALHWRKKLTSFGIQPLPEKAKEGTEQKFAFTSRDKIEGEKVTRVTTRIETDAAVVKAAATEVKEPASKLVAPAATDTVPSTNASPNTPTPMRTSTTPPPHLRSKNVTSETSSSNHLIDVSDEADTSGTEVTANKTPTTVRSHIDDLLGLNTESLPHSTLLPQVATPGAEPGPDGQTRDAGTQCELLPAGSVAIIGCSNDAMKDLCRRVEDLSRTMLNVQRHLLDMMAVQSRSTPADTAAMANSIKGLSLRMGVVEEQLKHAPR